MVRACKGCHGQCVRVKKFDIERNDGVWVVETQTFPCDYCGGLGIDLSGMRRKKKRRRRSFGTKVCELCGDEVERQDRTRHHLKPKSLNKHKSVFTAMLCANCHKEVHESFTNKELNEKYNTLDKLKHAIQSLRSGPVAQPGRAAGF